MRVLLGFEFGRGSGHVVLLRQLADSLNARVADLDAHFVMPPGRTAQAGVYNGPNFTFPPELVGVNAPGTIYPTLGESMCHMLFGVEDGLEARLNMWSRQMQSFKPDLAIADFAPCLIMACRGKVPCLVAGTGYTIPPPGAPHFPVKIDLGPDAKRLPESESLSRINLALVKAGCNTLGRLPEMIEGDAYALMTIPMFDPYWETREQDYCGVVHPAGSPRPLDRAEGCLAYFSYEANFDELAAGLNASGVQTLAHVGNMSAADCERYSTSSVTFTQKRFAFAKDMPGKAVIVHGGTLGVSSAALFAGVPQVSLYTHDETWHTSNALYMSQTGLVHPRKSANAEKIATMVRQAVSSPEMRGYSKALSERYADFRDGDALSKAADIALSLA